MIDDRMIGGGGTPFERVRGGGEEYDIGWFFLSAGASTSMRFRQRRCSLITLSTQPARMKRKRLIGPTDARGGSRRSDWGFTTRAGCDLSSRTGTAALTIFWKGRRSIIHGASRPPGRGAPLPAALGRDGRPRVRARSRAVRAARARGALPSRRRRRRPRASRRRRPRGIPRARFFVRATARAPPAPRAPRERLLGRRGAVPLEPPRRDAPGRRGRGPPRDPPVRARPRPAALILGGVARRRIARAAVRRRRHRRKGGRVVVGVARRRDGRRARRRGDGERGDAETRPRRRAFAFAFASAFAFAFAFAHPRALALLARLARLILLLLRASPARSAHLGAQTWRAPSPIRRRARGRRPALHRRGGRGATRTPISFRRRSARRERPPS